MAISAMRFETAITKLIVVMGLLASLFGCSKAPDADEAVIVQLRKAGSDLTKPHAIEFYLYFPSESAAGQAATRIRQMGFQADVSPGAQGEPWLCLGTKKVIPALTTIRAITRDLNALAKSLAGEYDGWEAKVEK